MADISNLYPQQPPNLLDTAGKAIGVANQAVQYDQQKLALAQKQLSAHREALFSLYNDPDVSLDKLRDVSQKGVAEGLWTPQQAATELTDFAKADSPAAIRQKLVPHIMKTLQAQAQAEAQFGQVQGTDVGPQVNLNRAPLDPRAAPTTVGVMKKGVTPGTGAWNPLTKQTEATGTDNPNPQVQPVAPAVTGPRPGGPVPSTAKVVGDKEAQDKGLYEKPDSKVILAPKPGTKEALESEASGGQKAAQMLQNTATDIPQQHANLANMAHDLAIADTGPGSKWVKDANAFSRYLTGFGINMTPAQVAAYESFGKLGNQIALQQAGMLGMSDARQQAAMGANPNWDLSTLGNKGIIHMLHGNLDAVNTKRNAWLDAQDIGFNGKKYGPDDYWKFDRDFNKDFDPRVFQFARMTPDERHIFLSHVQDKSKFIKNLDSYKSKGWVSPNGE